MDFPDSLSEKYRKLADELKVSIEDIEEHHVRGGGHGGQKINKTSNCVELHHIPTGIDVRYQHHRELQRNRTEAYKLLLLKIEEQKKGKKSEIQQKQFKIRKQKQRRSRKSKEKMLEEKHRRSDVKEGRRKIL